MNWPFLGAVAASWAISPFLAGLMSLGLIAVINKLILKGSGPGVLVRVAKGVPILMSLATAFTIYAILEGTRVGDMIESHPVETALLAVLITIPVYIASRSIVAHWVEGREDNGEGAEASFKHLQIGTSCYVAFAHGSNDVANSISPVIAISVVVHTGAMSAADNLTVPFWVLAIGGAGIATGIGLLGHPVMKTVGEKITKLTNSRGFSVDFSVASTVVVASIFGLPVSSSHAATGAVVGVGLVDGPKNVNFRILGKIVVAWLITIPVAAALTIGIFIAIRPLF